MGTSYLENAPINGFRQMFVEVPLACGPEAARDVRIRIPPATAGSVRGGAVQDPTGVQAGRGAEQAPEGEKEAGLDKLVLRLEQFPTPKRDECASQRPCPPSDAQEATS